MNHHGAGLRTLLDSDVVPRALARGERNADLSEADGVMLDYALKLTRTPASVGAGDVQVLKDAGFDDRAVLDICQVTSYYNYVNRLADGLGVELEPHWTDEALTVTRAEFDALRKESR